MKKGKFLLLFAVFFSSQQIYSTTVRFVNETKNGALARVSSAEIFTLDQNMSKVQDWTNPANPLPIDNLEHGKDYLIGVEYQGVRYTRSFNSSENTVDLSVYESVQKYPSSGITVRMLYQVFLSQKNELTILQYIYFSNESGKAFSEKEGGIRQVLPKDARNVEASVLLSGASQNWFSLEPSQLDDGSWLLPFPLKPGEHVYQITFRLPYSGKEAVLPLKTVYPQEDDFLFISRSEGLKIAGKNGKKISSEFDPEVGKDVYLVSPEEGELHFSGGRVREKIRADSPVEVSKGSLIPVWVKLLSLFLFAVAAGGVLWVFHRRKI